MMKSTKNAVLGIDASNIRRGGGVTHLIELLNALEPFDSGFTKIIVWSSTATLKKINENTVIKKATHRWIERSLLFRILWQMFVFSKAARKENCDIVFIPGGTFSGNFRPFVTMSQNLLPFEMKELSRYGFAWLAVKFWLLRFTQGSSFKRADGVIFLTKYAQVAIQKVTGRLKGKTAIIPHGIPNRFHMSPSQHEEQHGKSGPRFNVLYVSIIDVYKHQWNVAQAVADLHKQGFDIGVQFVGPAYQPSLNRLNKVIGKEDPQKSFIKYEGVISYEELHKKYVEADLFVFASSCENLPIILLEAMASGLPIACSQKGPMPEVLGDAGLYFDPEDSASIAAMISQYLQSAVLRKTKAEQSYHKALAYSWKRCSQHTMDFLLDVSHRQQ